MGVYKIGNMVFCSGYFTYPKQSFAYTDGVIKLPYKPIRQWQILFQTDNSNLSCGYADARTNGYITPMINQQSVIGGMPCRFIFNYITNE